MNEQLSFFNEEITIVDNDCRKIKPTEKDRAMRRAAPGECIFKVNGVCTANKLKTDEWTLVPDLSKCEKGCLCYATKKNRSK